MNTRMSAIKEQLKQFASTSRVRADWHEPDEQNVSASVTGNHLDNAFGSCQDGLPEDYQEFVVHLKAKNEILDINLADLLAIAAS